jgi:hypothetical protein
LCSERLDLKVDHRAADSDLCLDPIAALPSQSEPVGKLADI